MKQVGKYKVIKQIGRGASSKIFLAVDPFTSQQVAIKLFELDTVRGTLSVKAYNKLVMTEVSLVGKLEHPHILKIYDVVVDAGLCYLVMEYVGGGSLEAYTKAGHLLPFTTVAEIMYKCCKALEYAQAQGVIHRDIKPANILLQDDNDIKISDFGAAIVKNHETSQIVRIGSPAYMSPEQIGNQPVTHQTDIYSLGVTMFKLLTGKLPFRAGNSRSMLYQIMHYDPTPPRFFRPEIPEQLAAIVMRAIARDLSQRYRTWAEMARDLTSFLSLNILEEAEISESEKFETMRSLLFFERFRDTDLWEVLRFSKWHRVSKGRTILREGQKGNAFFILANGIVKVARKRKVLNFLHEGDCFGEIKRFPGSTFARTTSVVAGTDAMLIEIRLDTLDRASVGCRFQFDDAFLYILLKRLDSANTRISKLLEQKENI